MRAAAACMPAGSAARTRSGRCCTLPLTHPVSLLMPGGVFACCRPQYTSLLSRLLGPRGGKLDDITVVIGLVV